MELGPGVGGCELPADGGRRVVALGGPGRDLGGEAGSVGNAAVEAMGVGVPTIVFADGGGMIEHIDDGRTGFVVAHEQELNALVTRLLDDREQLGRAVGERGREAVRSKYAPVDAERRYEQLYLSAAGRPSAVDRLAAA